MKKFLHRIRHRRIVIDHTKSSRVRITFQLFGSFLKPMNIKSSYFNSYMYFQIKSLVQLTENAEMVLIYMMYRESSYEGITIFESSTAQIIIT